MRVWWIAAALSGCIVAPDGLDGGVEDAAPDVRYRDATLRDQSPPRDHGHPMLDAAPDALPIDAHLSPDASPAWNPPTVTEVAVGFVDVVCLDVRDFVPSNAFDTLVEFEWIVRRAPGGSLGTFVERFFNAEQPANGGEADALRTPTACLFIDVPGVWEVEARVRRRADDAGPFTAVEVTLDATRHAGLHLELSWFRPHSFEPEGTDLDLMLRHPAGATWAAIPWLCEPEHPEPLWGAVHRDIDEGAEAIDLLEPEAGAAYQVGLGPGAEPFDACVHAHITIWSDRRKRFDRYLWICRPDDVLDVATVHWGAETRVVPNPLLSD